MVRIGLMAKRNLLTSRRAFLGGVGAAAAGILRPRSVTAAAGEAVLLQAKTASLALRQGQGETTVSALVGTSPQLRTKRGGNLEIAFQNELQAPAAINWHGLDGAPLAEPLTGQGPLPSGAKASLGISLRHAGTLFGDLGLLAGPSRAMPLIVEETEPPAVDRDEVLLIEAFRLRQDGTAVSPGSDPTGAAAPVFTVNGLISCDIAAHSNERLRFRLINAGQRDVIAVKFETLEVRVMAVDGLPAEPFFARNSAIVLAPGGRADAFVDMTLPPGSVAQILLHDGRQARVLGTLTIAEALRPAPLAPAPPLPPNGLPAQLELRNAQRFEIALAGNEWVAPAQFATSSAPAFRVKRGRVAVLALSNRAAVASVFHLHGHHFRLLDRLDDGWKPYWLDTLAIEPGQTQRIAFAAETAGRWLIESTATDWAAPNLLRWYSVE
jgi:FtsP/CotA-like multicopper oxidase with cupredoxin domain